MPKLTIRSGPKTGSVFPFDKAITVGRTGEADVLLPDPKISRRHAMLAWRDDQCVVVDLGSANGTFVNGRLLAGPARLHDGDVLTFGTVTAAYSQETPAKLPAPSGPAVRYAEPGQGSPEVLVRVSADPQESRTALATDAAVASMSRRLRFLSDLGRKSSTVFDERALLSFVVEEVLDIMPQAARAFIMLWDQDQARLAPAASCTRSRRNEEIVASRTLLQDVMTRREAVLVADAQADARYSQAESIYALGIRSAICAPVLFEKDMFGVIQVDSTSGGQPFDKSDLSLTLGIASQLGMAMAYARLHAKIVERELVERDMTLAREIQRQFLPEHPPELSGFSFAIEYTPALAVGGDFYDFIELGPGLLGIVVGDVSGKGVSAALYGAKLLSDLRYEAAGQQEPAVILERTNRAISRGNRQSMFATVVLVVLDAASRKVMVASAGHPLPLVRDGTGQITVLARAGDVPVGVDESATFGQHGYELDADDSVLLYTDGIPEGMNEQKALFGDTRLRDALRRSDGTPAGMKTALLADLRGFVGRAPASDDVTVVCFGRRPAG